MYIPILYTDGFIKAFIYYILDSTNMTALHDIDASHLELFDDLFEFLSTFASFPQGFVVYFYSWRWCI